MNELCNAKVSLHRDFLKFRGQPYQRATQQDMLKSHTHQSVLCYPQTVMTLPHVMSTNISSNLNKK